MTYCEFCKREHGDIHADISFLLIKNEHGSFIVIDDLNKGNRSVTNDIEYVLWAIKDYYDAEFSTDFPIDDFKIIYKDSDGVYDQVKHQGINFDAFYPLRIEDMEEAIKAAA